MLKLFKHKKNKEPSNFDKTFDDIKMWHNLPDSRKKFAHLAQLYNIAAQNMSLLVGYQLKNQNFTVGPYDPVCASKYYKAQASYYRQKFYTSQIEDDTPGRRFVALPDRNVRF